MMFNTSGLISLILIFTHLFSCSCSKNESGISDHEEVEEEKIQIRVMTYNIHHANSPETGKIDLDAIADIIKKSNADLIALQELDSITERSDNVYQLKYLAEKLNMEFHFMKAIPYQSGAYGVGVLSRFPIDMAQIIKLPKIGEVKSEDRVIGMVKVSLPENKSIYFASTHWDVVSEENRRLQAEKACQEAIKLDGPFILAGDFNTRPDSESMKILTNVFTEASVKNEPTIPVNNPTRKIDHIVFAKNNDFSLLSEEVIYNIHTRKASDHLPFVVDLQVN